MKEGEDSFCFGGVGVRLGGNCFFGGLQQPRDTMLGRCSATNSWIDWFWPLDVAENEYG